MSEGLMERFLNSSHFSGGNAAYIEELYEIYLHEPNSIPEEWSSFFDTLPRTNGSLTPDVSHETVKQHFELLEGAKLDQHLLLALAAFIWSTSVNR